jgi:hypothetical protein
MRYSVRDSKGRFAKAQQAIYSEERIPVDQEADTGESLLKTFLQGAAALLLAFIAVGLLAALFCVLMTPR